MPGRHTKRCYHRYYALLSRQCETGLTPGEREELLCLRCVLHAAEEPMYRGILARPRAAVLVGVVHG